MRRPRPLRPALRPSGRRDSSANRTAYSVITSATMRALRRIYLIGVVCAVLAAIDRRRARACAVRSRRRRSGRARRAIGPRRDRGRHERASRDRGGDGDANRRYSMRPPKTRRAQPFVRCSIARTRPCAAERAACLPSRRIGRAALAAGLERRAVRRAARTHRRTRDVFRRTWSARPASHLHQAGPRPGHQPPRRRRRCRARHLFGATDRSCSIRCARDADARSCHGAAVRAETQMDSWWLRRTARPLLVVHVTPQAIRDGHATVSRAHVCHRPQPARADLDRLDGYRCCDAASSLSASAPLIGTSERRSSSSWACSSRRERCSGWPRPTAGPSRSSTPPRLAAPSARCCERRVIFY